MTIKDIKQGNFTEPYSFNTDMEEEWYNIGLLHGVEIAEKEVIEKACSIFKRYLWSTVEIPKIETMHSSDAINVEEMQKGLLIENMVYRFKRTLEE